MENSKKSIVAQLKDLIRTIPDFPKQGIQFKDITPLLKDSDALHEVPQLLAHAFLDQDIDYVAGLESRGFLFGPMLAKVLHAGFIMIRKPGKLPSETVSSKYELEYGTDTIEMHADALEEGDRILIHDDLIATGGSVKAATNLIEKAGGIVAGYSFLIELAALKGREQLAPEVPTEVLLKL